MHQKSLGGLVKTRVPEPSPGVSDSVGRGCGLVVCISNKFPAMLTRWSRDLFQRTAALVEGE